MTQGVPQRQKHIVGKILLLIKVRKDMSWKGRNTHSRRCNHLILIIELTKNTMQKAKRRTLIIVIILSRLNQVRESNKKPTNRKVRKV